MEQVYLRYPEDREAAVFYALALNATALPTDKTYANQRKAAEILNKVWTEQPNHPGVVHYLIHSDDSAQFAEAGLDAAICYSKIAPDVPHALHMPSHIFTRLGMWQQSIDSNRAANAAALAYVRKSLGPEGFDSETVHTMDYLEYAYLQTAQDRRAKEVVDELIGFHQSAGAEPAHGLRRRGDPGALRARTPRLAGRRFAVGAGDRVPARTLPMGRGDDLVCPRARRRTDRGHCRRPDGNRQVAIARRQAVEAKDTYWANQVEVQRLGAAGILAHVQGDDKKAVELVRAAADLEATMDKHPATPAAVLPARELLADLLLELNQPDAALKEYEQVLRTDPNRFRSILGKARAAKQLGDIAASRDAYQKLVALSKSAVSERPELSEAKAFLTN